jgi:hypothetical protein
MKFYFSNINYVKPNFINTRADKSSGVCMTLERTNYESGITASAAKIQQQISRKLDNN